MGSDKFAYKLRWLERLRAYLGTHVAADRAAVLCGDFNVAPAALDVWDERVWEGSVLCTPQEREALGRAIGASAMTDLVRAHHPNDQIFTWWDYRQLAFAKNRGLRIDHIFVTAPLVPRVKSVTVDRSTRKGAQPSDHAAVVVEIDLALAS